eukprot:CAMPEP_0170601348 /NCGR_PEP_ID=MMETSP0224-20130122/17811_1 /TAXON_ID=285029 /ORGANISM="Togula jolla, Strain CCCM 725" /LENGTH=426 /DNA_ID=CAMNT_0010926117 /DNA_START=62 /DNA_END=1342 /DNA_ORIENTATION=-
MPSSGSASAARLGAAAMLVARAGTSAYNGDVASAFLHTAEHAAARAQGAQGPTLRGHGRSPASQPARVGRSDEGGLRAGPAVATGLVLVPLVGARRRQARKSGKLAMLATGSARKTAEVATDDASPDEVANWEMEAAKLRAEVNALEAEREEVKRQEKLRWFKLFDSDGSGTVDASEIRKGLKEKSGLDMDQTEAERLLSRFDSNQDGVLQPEEFDVERFDQTLDNIRSEDRAVREAALQKEREEARKLREAKELEERWASLNDAALDTRIYSALSYLLPLLDGLRFGLPLLALFPFLQPIFQVLLIPVAILNLVPFGLGQLLIFIGLQMAAGNPELPTLARFNFRQAVLLDVALFVPILLSGLFSMAEDRIPVEVSVAVSALVFVALAGCVLYAMTCSLLGVPSAGIPVISKAAGQSLGLTDKPE